MKELPRFSKTTTDFLAKVPLSLLFAEVREEAMTGSITYARMMLASVLGEGPESPFARRITIGKAPEVREPVNPSIRALEPILHYHPCSGCLQAIENARRDEDQCR